MPFPVAQYPRKGLFPGVGISRTVRRFSPAVDIAEEEFIGFLQGPFFPVRCGGGPFRPVSNIERGAGKVKEKPRFSGRSREKICWTYKNMDSIRKAF